MIMGNKGEWSELYVLLRLLADGKLYVADTNLTKLEDVYFPILKIFREEAKAGRLEYRCSSVKREVELYLNGDKIKTISSDKLNEYAQTCFDGIRAGTQSAFSIKEADEIMNDLNCTTIKAPSENKSDIQMQIYDASVGQTSIVGYSIKSDLGNSPTLLNASKSTNFRYEIKGITDKDAAAINAINTKSKIRDRIEYIMNHWSMTFDKPLSDSFNGNLLLIDSMMDTIVSEMLIEYYQNSTITCSEIATAIEEKDPLGYNQNGVYRYKIKKLLCAVALGMMPARKWNGQDEATGGYIIVKDTGEVLAYHLYNRNAFETYLLNNTRLETPSSTKHQFGSVYQDDGKYYINLNLQIRFL